MLSNTRPEYVFNQILPREYKGLEIEPSKMSGHEIMMRLPGETAPTPNEDLNALQSTEMRDVEEAKSIEP
ncbi:hypothetical protein RB195_009311 [Necator americanus]|uniref:MSP domain-containing protein n=1 Tax=Necator americanus TaxID=51031 RepID=A0ABR1CSS6_NECAM